ncbi:hypothetical protein MUP95_10750 [bacterium]|nr:hypothetical protein [bacterium]
MNFLIVVIGYLVTLVSWGWIAVIAFKESLACGLLFTCIPFYSFYYIFTRWIKVREPFLIHLLGWIILVMGL